ncbi:hypothetical protein H0H87_006054 [Tephrocybe sp. NHM501043]|nr:hypothetical protein H0H87_006054 [Tephrocybe sp. NHM501043]
MAITKGLDWHGPSARDAWATIDSLATILQNNKEWNRWEIGYNPRVVLMGHSNGGQGAWSAHYADPALRAILESSLTPDDNDLYLSNLVDIPILAVHGGSDTNVPPWHSREYVSILKTLGSKNVSLREVPNEGHWFSSVFDNEEVQSFLEAVLTTPRSLDLAKEFTLTVTDPAASGSLHGWRIESLVFPGR